VAKSDSKLIEIGPDQIDPNPDNPRLIFREADMNQLLESIDEVGIKVPVTTYMYRRRYVLIDGERRWRCAKKLNMKSVPAIVQPRPAPLENLLTMFNIHNVRTDWDLMPMALKLADVRDMLEEEGQPASPKDLAGLTGVSLPTVRRALELLELPKRYQRMLLNEAKKPKDQQTISADLFVEVNKSKRVIERYAPEVFDKVSESEYVDAMVVKYQKGVVNNVVDYRDVSKIARAERVGGDTDEVTPTIVKLVKRPSYGIEDAYDRTVRPAYEIRDVSSRVQALAGKLASLASSRGLSKSLRADLRRLRKEIDRLIGTE
jgi:ParB family chromosome partitioning protein